MDQTMNKTISEDKQAEKGIGLSHEFSCVREW
jgi:hypothetical protein